MGDLFHGLGYATLMFGKRRLGGDPQSLQTATRRRERHDRHLRLRQRAEIMQIPGM